MEIFQKGGIKETSKGWIVPSQSGNGSYLVYKEGMRSYCTCPDCELRGKTCKHQVAIDLYLDSRTDAQGKTTITKTVKVTYRQDWQSKGQLHLVPHVSPVYGQQGRVHAALPQEERCGKHVQLGEGQACRIQHNRADTRDA